MKSDGPIAYSCLLFKSTAWREAPNFMLVMDLDFVKQRTAVKISWYLDYLDSCVRPHAVGEASGFMDSNSLCRQAAFFALQIALMLC